MSARIEQIRKAKGFSRAKAAATVGMSERHLYRLERGLSPLKRMHVLALCDAYGVTEDELREGCEVAA